MSSKARIALAAVLFIGFLFGAVFPTRTYLTQRQEISAATERLELFRRQNAHLEEEKVRLGSNEEIERMARAHFNLVKPGEEAYAIVPGPDPTPAPAAAGPAAPAPPKLTDREEAPPVLAWIRDTLLRFF